MNPRDRMAELMILQQALGAAWPALLPWIEVRRGELVEQLVTQESEETRGKIKQLDELKALPALLQSEAESLQHPQEADELP